MSYEFRRAWNKSVIDYLRLLSRMVFCEHGNKASGSTKNGNYWITRTATGFSRRALLHEVSCLHLHPEEPKKTAKTFSLKIPIFWDIMPCSPSKVNVGFRGIFRLYLQDRRTSQARNQRESRRQAERRLIFNGLHGVVSQKNEVFITTAVRTSNPTKNNISRLI
jgi:hypothetical protein